MSGGTRPTVVRSDWSHVSILLLGVDHTQAPFALLERLAVPAEHTRKVVHELTTLDHVLEAVVVSTCNRVEIYADLARFHDGYDQLVAWLAERGGLTREQLEPLLVAKVDEDAAEHLFAVSGGLESMVVGEQQIAMQVRDAMEEARTEGTAGRMLQRLFRQAVRVGRRVRRETSIGNSARSMVDVGLEAVVEHLAGDITGRDVLVVGAGEVGALTVAQLADSGVAGIAVWNRSPDKATRLARKVGATVVPADGLVDAVAVADVVVCTTGASAPVLDLPLLEEAGRRRSAEAPDGRARQVVILDLAVPRNVAPAAAALPEVTIVDIAEVRDVAQRGETGAVVAEARSLVAEEAEGFRRWLRQIEVEPTIRELRVHAERVRQEELERLSARLATLDQDQRQAVEALTEGIVNTLLHEPTVRLKRLADTNPEHHVGLLAELFDLDVEPEGEQADVEPTGGQ